MPVFTCTRCIIANCLSEIPQLFCFLRYARCALTLRAHGMSRGLIQSSRLGANAGYVVLRARLPAQSAHECALAIADSRKLCRLPQWVFVPIWVSISTAVWGPTLYMKCCAHVCARSARMHAHSRSPMNINTHGYHVYHVLYFGVLIHSSFGGVRSHVRTYAYIHVRTYTYIQRQLLTQIRRY
jgi:hypothetical protein